MNFADQNEDSSDEESERADTGDLPPDISSQPRISPKIEEYADWFVVACSDG